MIYNSVRLDKMEIKTKVSPDLEDDGYWVECLDLLGCFFSGGQH